MRKIYFVLVVSILVISVSTNAQTEKKEPPPPPPPPKKETVKYNVIDEKVSMSKPENSPVITVRGKLADEFYQRNPSVAQVSRQGNITTLKMKDGTTEKYDMSKKEEDKSFTDKYGTSPIPPPPPPPKPKNETIKYNVVDEKVKVPPPPPPPKKKIKA